MPMGSSYSERFVHRSGFVVGVGCIGARRPLQLARSAAHPLSCSEHCGRAVVVNWRGVEPFVLGRGCGGEVVARVSVVM